jgi:hypothetical protein
VYLALFGASIPLARVFYYAEARPLSPKLLGFI